MRKGMEALKSWAETQPDMHAFYLYSACCIPLSNPEARRREQEIFQKIAFDTAMREKIIAQGQARSRWKEREQNLVEPPVPVLIAPILK